MSFSFSYPGTPYYYRTGVTIDISRVFVGSEPSPHVYSIAPGLPSGISFNTTNGNITGFTSWSNIITPTTYNVSIQDNPSTASFVLGINFSPAFLYPFTPYILQISKPVTIIPQYVISNLQNISYSLISPTSLPSGLTLNTANGIISGTPTSVSALTIYTIRAINGGVTFDTTLSISIQILPIISYAQTKYSQEQNVAFTILPVAVTGQTNVTYSIEGCDLPLGVIFNVSTGAISGLPRLITSVRSYTITVTNPVGSSVTTLFLSIIKTILAPQVQSDWVASGMCLTNADIAMRRKAEILKYKKNSSGLTQNQNWSLLVQGKGPYAKRVWANQNTLGSNPNILGLFRNGNSLICNTNGVVCAPTSSSNVPGPVMNLCYNPAVPLVGYVQPIRTKTNIGFKWPQSS